MKIMFCLISAIGLFMMFGCGSSGGSAAATSSPASGNSSGRSATAINASGGHLVDANGFVLYTASACSGSCLTTWPPLTASQTPSAGTGVTLSAIGLSAGQVSYNGHLLYYFQSDTASGQATGDGVGGFTLVAP